MGDLLHARIKVYGLFYARNKMHQQITISSTPINQDDQGRYFLNDLHKSAGGESRHKPSEWLRNKQAIELITEIEKAGITAILTKQGLGTYATKEIVYAYAMWISPKFHIAVIRAYDAIQNPLSNLPSLPQTYAEALRALADESEAKQVALAQIETDKPKVEFAMQVRNLQGSCSISDFAKTIGTGRNKFYEQLRDDKYLMRNNRPYQQFIDEPRDLFVVVEGISYTDGNGKTFPAFETRITGKGQVFLEKKYRSQ